MACFSAQTVDRTPYLGVLGIFTIESHLAYRHAIRNSWGRLTEGILPRLVLRGVGASPALLNESAMHGDIVLLNASAGLSRREGPLISLFLWFDCAIKTWPAAEMVMHAYALHAHAEMVTHALRANAPPVLAAGGEGRRRHMDPLGERGSAPSRLTRCTRAGGSSQTLDFHERRASA